MKRLVVLFLFVCVVTSARADWNDVKEGLDVGAVLAAVGRPLMINHSKTGAQVMWTYDEGAYVLFENGRVRFWQPPHPKRTSHARTEGKG